MQVDPAPDEGAATAPSFMPIRIRLLWYPQPQFAGYLVAEHLMLGATDGIRIECQPMQPDLGPVDAVLTGMAEFAVASPAHMLESGCADDLVMLLAIQQASALVYPARRAAGVAQLSDLRGHRLAVWPGREDLELRWMLHRGGVSDSDVTWLPTGDTVSAVIDHAADCAQMTTYHELHQLEERSGGLDDYIIFRPESDATLLKDGLIARRDWVERHPAETQALIDAVLAGWTIAFTQPEEAVRICCLARPDMGETEQAAQLAAIRDLALCGATLSEGLGFPDPDHLRRAEEALAVVDGVRATGSIDARFWQAASAASRATAW